MKYLLDTNAWIEILNDPIGLVAANLAKRSPSEISLCSVVLGELLVGAYNSSRPAKNLALIQNLIRQFACLPFDDPSADAYARVRSQLEASGQRIGPYDMQIAGIAMHHALTVVTHNLAEFSRILGLAVEDWQVP